MTLFGLFGLAKGKKLFRVFVLRAASLELVNINDLILKIIESFRVRPGMNSIICWFGVSILINFVRPAINRSDKIQREFEKEITGLLDFSGCKK